MRKAKPKKRILLPDPKFSDVAVTRFVNNLMLDGKKSIAYTIFYDSLELVGKKMKDADKSPLEVWKPYLENLHVCMTDATCYESHMRFPTDMKLLWESLEGSTGISASIAGNLA
jgi:ribosomal protein S7